MLHSVERPSTKFTLYSIPPPCVPHILFCVTRTKQAETANFDSTHDSYSILENLPNKQVQPHWCAVQPPSFPKRARRCGLVSQRGTTYDHVLGGILGQNYPKIPPKRTTSISFQLAKLQLICGNGEVFSSVCENTYILEAKQQRSVLSGLSQWLTGQGMNDLLPVSDFQAGRSLDKMVCKNREK